MLVFVSYAIRPISFNRSHQKNWNSRIQLICKEICASLLKFISSQFCIVWGKIYNIFQINTEFLPISILANYYYLFTVHRESGCDTSGTSKNVGFFNFRCGCCHLPNCSHYLSLPGMHITACDLCNIYNRAFIQQNWKFGRYLEKFTA